MWFALFAIFVVLIAVIGVVGWRMMSGKDPRTGR
jgi:hypothetical protein